MTLAGGVLGLDTMLQYALLLVRLGRGPLANWCDAGIPQLRSLKRFKDSWQQRRSIPDLQINFAASIMTLRSRS